MTLVRTSAPATPAQILVVDDDRRVRELLEIALTAHGFSVTTAADGDEAVKRALSERPDLVVLDVRLPKRSGLDVCEILRGDPEDPTVPIVLVSAASETDARVQAFARGADDYLAKPFSPKELIARIKRLLSRASEAREARLRSVELERELQRARDEARRADRESRREQSWREAALTLGRDLHATLDLDALAARLLATVRSRVGANVAALLARDRRGTMLVPDAIRGDGLERVAGLEVRRDGELSRIVTGLGRPVLCAELERVPEVRAELAPFIAARFTMLVPFVSRDGLLALIAVDERPDGARLSSAEAEILKGLAEIAAVAMENALALKNQTTRLLELAAERMPGDAAAAAARAESAAIVARAARMLALPARHVDLVMHAVALGAAAAESDGRRELDRLCECDPTGRVRDLRRLLERAVHADANVEKEQERRAIELIGLGLDLGAARALGAEIEEALAYTHTRNDGRIDPVTRSALESAAREYRAPGRAA